MNQLYVKMNISLIKNDCMFENNKVREEGHGFVILLCSLNQEAGSPCM